MRLYHFSYWLLPRVGVVFFIDHVLTPPRSFKSGRDVFVERVLRKTGGRRTNHVPSDDPSLHEDALQALVPRVVTVAKRAIVHMIAAVAEAAGDGPFGGGHAATTAQHVCIQTLRKALRLDRRPGGESDPRQGRFGGQP